MCRFLHGVIYEKGVENISTYHYLADPSAGSDGDTFYILTDVDDYSPQKDFNYDIVGLNAFFPRMSIKAESTSFIPMGQAVWA